MMIEKKLKQLSEEIEIPDTLKPDQIEQKLQHSKAGRQSRYARRFTTRLALGAACILLVAAVGNYLLASGILNHNSLDTAAEQNPGPQSDSSSPAAVSQPPEGKATPEGEVYETLRQKITLDLESSGDCLNSENVYDLAEAVPEQSKAADTAGSTADSAQRSSSKEYSGTNLQVQNVDEGDVVKTDGTYIYTSSADTFGSSVRIYKADGKNTKKLTELTVESANVSEMYLKDHFLVLVGSGWEKQSSSEKKKSSGAYTENNFQQENTLVLVYDITDIENPKQTFHKNQSGIYSNSRISGNYLYTYSVMTAESADKKDKPKCYIPSVGGSLVPEDRLVIPSGVSSHSYMVFTSLDITGGTDFADSLSILGGDGICYVSEENIYIASPTADYTKTTISRFHYQEGKLTDHGEKTFRGKILNQFSMDEYEGKLRFVATTENSGRTKTSNGLYVLDENMELLGKVDRLAKSERIYSARFMGDKAYFVTYRETDPVFLVDLSDPSTPVVKDKLKIPGFSEYLQSYGEGLMLGIGSNINKNWDTQIKLTMFDISSDTNIREMHTKLLEMETYGLAGKNHKAILADPGKNLIGFAAESYNKKGKQKITYRLYSYDRKKGFQKLATLSPKDMEMSSARGLYIGEHFYLADEDGIGGIYVYDLNTFRQLAKVTK